MEVLCAITDSLTYTALKMYICNKSPGSIIDIYRDTDLILKEYDVDVYVLIKETCSHFQN